MTGVRETPDGTAVDFTVSSNCNARVHAIPFGSMSSVADKPCRIPQIRPLRATKPTEPVRASMPPRQFSDIQRRLLGVGSMTKLFVSSTNTDPIHVDIDNPKKHAFEQFAQPEALGETGLLGNAGAGESLLLDSQRIPPPQPSPIPQAHDRQYPQRPPMQQFVSRRFKTVETMRPPDVPGQYIPLRMDDSATRDLAITVRCAPLAVFCMMRLLLIVRVWHVGNRASTRRHRPAAT